MSMQHIPYDKLNFDQTVTLTITWPHVTVESGLEFVLCQRWQRPCCCLQQLFDTTVNTSLCLKSTVKMTYSFSLVQHISGLTHKRGHTLDLICTLGLTMNSLSLTDLVSDNKFIICDSSIQATSHILKQTVCSCIFNNQSALKVLIYLLWFM